LPRCLIWKIRERKVKLGKTLLQCSKGNENHSNRFQCTSLRLKASDGQKKPGTKSRALSRGTKERGGRIRFQALFRNERRQVLGSWVGGRPGANERGWRYQHGNNGRLQGQELAKFLKEKGGGTLERRRSKKEGEPRRR